MLLLSPGDSSQLSPNTGHADCLHLGCELQPLRSLQVFPPNWFVWLNAAPEIAGRSGSCGASKRLRCLKQPVFPEQGPTSISLLWCCVYTSHSSENRREKEIMSLYLLPSGEERGWGCSLWLNHISQSSYRSASRLDYKQQWLLKT